MPYLLYGTLSDPDFLAGKLKLDARDLEMGLRGGKIRGWRLKAWGQYKALIKADEEAVVEGMGYELKNEEELGKLAG